MQTSTVCFDMDLKLVKRWSGACHPGFMVEGQHILQSWNDGSLECASLKLVPRILTQTCCSSTSYILIRVSTYRTNVKGMVGWVTIPHRYNRTQILTQTEARWGGK